jgi:hypothetical protein
MPGRVVGNADEQVSDVELRVEAVELGAFDQRVHCGGAPAAGVGEQIVLAADGNCPVILPMSGRRSKSIITGTHSMGVAFDASMLNGPPAARWFMSR